MAKNKRPAPQTVPTHTQLSEYELMVQENVAKRRKILESLGIDKVKEELEEVLSTKPAANKPSSRGIARVKKEIEPPVRRRSLRQQKMTPDGADLQLPSEKEIANAESSSETPRPPPGPAPLWEYHRSPEEIEEYVKELRAMKMSWGSGGVWASDAASIIKTMGRMKITEADVAKVIPTRTFSVQIHPTTEKLLVMIGGKYGELGLWDVGREDDTDGAYYFNVHNRPINCMTVDPWQPQYVYTTSYDGSLRRTDLESSIVQQVYSYDDENMYNVYTSWHAHRDENTILVGGSLGEVIQVDMRENGDAPRIFQVHNGKSAKVLTVHPTKNNYFASASSNGNVYLWDVRKFHKNKPIAECPHGRTISGLEFSPITGNSLISTCSDDHLRFISCDLKSFKVDKMIRHNNQTGRWLTTFRTRFLPGREDMVVVGSMKQPRRMEVWGSDGKLIHEFMGEDLGSVSSVSAFHPTRPILAGCNSSGRVHVFKA